KEERWETKIDLQRAKTAGIMTIPTKSGEVSIMQQDIVIFAPHQDDEILGGYAVIRQQPEHIYVVFLTNGDYEGADIARTRWQESCAALTHLGVPRDHILTLGYADTGMPRPVSFLWRLWHGEPGLLLASSVG